MIKFYRKNKRYYSADLGRYLSAAETVSALLNGERIFEENQDVTDERAASILGQEATRQAAASPTFLTKLIALFR